MRVLFVGNSHTYFHDMPHTFARMCQQLTGEKPEVTMLAYSNRDLHWHREEYFALRFALLYGNYDYCVLQQQAHPFPDAEVTRRSLQRIRLLCDRSGTTPVLFMTWAMRDEPENFTVMSRFYHDLSEEWNMKMVPIGDLFETVLKKHPKMELYWSDGAHASCYGDYLIAASFAAFLCGASDLSPLDDNAIEFQLDFEGEDGMPLAIEEKHKAEINLDPFKTKIIKDAIEQVARITHYESLLDQLLGFLQSDKHAKSNNLDMISVVNELNSYYSGGQWKNDFEDDESGFLPERMKRGVLSEDALYNALESFETERNRSC